MVAQVLELLAVHREFARVKQVHAKIDEGYEQQEVEWGDHMRAKQRCELAEAKDPRDHNNEQRRQPHRWIDANHHAQGEAPREPSRSDATAESPEQRPQNMTSKPLAYGPRHQHRRVRRAQLYFWSPLTIGSVNPEKQASVLESHLEHFPVPIWTTKTLHPLQA